jgi:hypothetical protein
MKMLLLKRTATAKDGTPSRYPIVRTRTKKFGQVTGEQAISVKRDVLITGPHGSGKTRWAEKLVAGAPWKGKAVVYLRVVDPITKWADNPLIAEHVTLEVWKSMRPYQRIEALIQYVREKRSVLVIDDAHKATGRKADLLARCASAADVLVTTAHTKQGIPLTLRLLVNDRGPQEIALSSDAAYDATSLIFWLFTVAALSIGWYEAAGVLAMTKVLSGGRNAAKQT